MQEKPSSDLKDDGNDEVLELKERLAGYNLESSPDHTEESWKLKCPQVQVKAAAKKMHLSAGADISSDEDFEVEVAAAAENKKKGGRKPANAKAAKPPAATRKRGPANKQSQQMGQKLITEPLKLSENSGLSLEKKVRKMRASPFNKKNGCVLGKDRQGR